MADPLSDLDPLPLPDVSDCITEDDTPVDSLFSERQMRLLTDILYASWKTDRPFVAFANVGLFTGNERYPLVPDVMLSLDVSVPEDPRRKENSSYFIWRYGKPPDLVLEIVSNRVGGELAKAERYARMGIGYYVIYDPDRHLGERTLRAYELHGTRYVDLLDVSWIEQLGLGLTVAEGRFQGMEGPWLRWCDRNRRLLPMPDERAAEAEERAAEAEERAADAQARADRLAARLRELGLEE